MIIDMIFYVKKHMKEDYKRRRICTDPQKLDLRI